MIRTIIDTEDVKTRKTLAHSVIDEVLTKKPYTTAMVLVLSNTQQPQGVDYSKYARECLKNMTAEDFVHLYWF